MDIQKTRHKKLFTQVESHASAVSLLNSGEQRYMKVTNNNNNLQAYFDSETHMYKLTTDSLVINSALIHLLTLTTDGLSGQLYMCTLTTDGPVILTTSHGQIDH